MGFTWRSNGGTAAGVACDEFAEVVYSDDKLLVVHVAQGMLPDMSLENALVDALALSEARADTEAALLSVAHAFGLQAHPEGDAAHRAITITPSTLAAGPDAAI